MIKVRTVKPVYIAGKAVRVSIQTSVPCDVRVFYDTCPMATVRCEEQPRDILEIFSGKTMNFFDEGK